MLKTLAQSFGWGFAMICAALTLSDAAANPLRYTASTLIGILVAIPVLVWTGRHILIEREARLASAADRQHAAFMAGDDRVGLYGL